MDRITEKEFHRVVLWLDANSMELSACYDFEKQRNGEVVRPLLGCPEDNPMCLDVGGYDCTGPGCINPIDPFTVSADSKPQSVSSAVRAKVSIHGGILRINGEKPAKMNIELFTLSGRRVFVHRETEPVSHTTIPLNRYRLATNAYVVKVDREGRNMVRVVRNR